MKTGEKIRALRKAKQMTILELAAAIGSDVGNISRLERGVQGYKESTLMKIADALGVQVSDIFLFNQKEVSQEEKKEKGKKGNNTYKIDVLNVQASAGSGAIVKGDFIETIKSIEYATEYAKTLFNGRPEKSIKMITVTGDSMKGTIDPGDQIFIDMNVRSFDNDGIYIFVFGETLHIKRLQMQKNRLAVLSDNKLYDPWYIDKEDQNKFFVTGKVLLSQSQAYKRHG